MVLVAILLLSLSVSGALLFRMVQGVPWHGALYLWSWEFGCLNLGGVIAAGGCHNNVGAYVLFELIIYGLYCLILELYGLTSNLTL
jgi:hypothetical protein